MEAGKAFWIWYPGDMELYYGMKQNFSRVERGFGWPAFWKSEGFRNRIVLSKTYHLEKETSFEVLSDSIGFVLVVCNETGKEEKYPFNRKIFCQAGEVTIRIHLAKIESFPCAYVKGEIICSDGSWGADDYAKSLPYAGYSRYFINEDQNPAIWRYDEKEYRPVKTDETGDGVLFEFETELTAEVEVTYKKEGTVPQVFCGESAEEALDLQHCYYSWFPDPVTGKCPCCAVRFVYIPGFRKDEINVTAHHRYVDIPVRADFHSNDKLIERIWQVSCHTFRLCSGIFYIDGVKRDKWIWSGDAFQSILIGRYLFADPDINRRTLRALRGNDPVTGHINTIADYSFFWILGVWEHYLSYGDLDFIRSIYPQMESLMEFCLSQTDDQGLFVGREGDWIYIDWADIDKDGPVCAEQFLFAKCLLVMAQICMILQTDPLLYQKKGEELLCQVERLYWDEEKKGYISSFTSGNRQVTKHAGILAVVLELVSEERKKEILEHTLQNDTLPQITTPYFKFYELDALCKMGQYGIVLEKIKEYWGGMLSRGAVTFWEEYDPDIPESEQYDMYGDRFGKSLCHAWGASPIYLIGKYFIGVEIKDPAEGTYEVHPQLESLGEVQAVIPVKDRQIMVTGNKDMCKIEESKWKGCCLDD